MNVFFLLSEFVRADEIRNWIASVRRAHKSAHFAVLGPIFRFLKRLAQDDAAIDRDDFKLEGVALVVLVPLTCPLFEGHL